MAKLAKNAVLTIDQEDVSAILTEELCRYSSFADLRVEYVTQLDDGGFELALTPRPVEQKEVA